MKAIAQALTSIANLTGLTFFNDLAKPLHNIVTTRERIRMEIVSKKSRIASTVNDVKKATNQNKAS